MTCNLEQVIHRYMPLSSELREFTEKPGPDVLADRNWYWLFGEDGIALTIRSDADAGARKFYEAISGQRTIGGLALIGRDSCTPYIVLANNPEAHITFEHGIDVAKLFQDSERCGAQELLKLLRSSTVHVFPGHWDYNGSTHVRNLCRMRFNDALDKKYILFSTKEPNSIRYDLIETLTSEKATNGRLVYRQARPARAQP